MKKSEFRTKIKLLFAMLISLSVGAMAQAPHAYYSDVALSAEGATVPRASVLVYKAGTTTPAQLYKGTSAGTTKISWVNMTPERAITKSAKQS